MNNQSINLEEKMWRISVQHLGNESISYSVAEVMANAVYDLSEGFKTEMGKQGIETFPVPEDLQFVEVGWICVAIDLNPSGLVYLNCVHDVVGDSESFVIETLQNFHSVYALDQILHKLKARL